DCPRRALERVVHHGADFCLRHRREVTQEIHVAARTKRLACSGQHDGAYRIVTLETLQDSDETQQEIGSKGVADRRTVESNRPDTVFNRSDYFRINILIHRELFCDLLKI